MLVVKEVDEDSQAAQLGIVKGSRGRSIAGERVQKTDDLVAIVQALKAQKVPQVEVAFSPPPLVARLASRPFGMTVSHDRALGLYLVSEVSGVSAAAGVKAGMALTTVGGTDANTLRLTKLIELLRETPLPANLIFELVPGTQAEPDNSSKSSSLKRKAPDENGPPEEERPAKKSATETSNVKVDLSQPLGIFFDDCLVAKSVQEGSQAARAGVCKGWHALAADGEPLHKTADLVGRIKALKAQGVASTTVAFVHEATASAQAPMAEKTREEVAPKPRAAAHPAPEPQQEEALPEKRKTSDGGDGKAPPKKVRKLEVSEAETLEARIVLSEPLGIFFDDTLRAKDVQAGSQADKAGMRKGWRVCSIDGEALQTTKELVTRIKALKAKSVSAATLTFADSAAGVSAANSAQDQLAEMRRRAEEAEAKLAAAIQDHSPQQNGKASLDASVFTMNVDLSSPLGIFFDDKLTVKGVQEGSQAAKVGVSQGWRARSMDGDSFETPKALLTRIKALKAQGVAGASLAFLRCSAAEPNAAAS